MHQYLSTFEKAMDWYVFSETRDDKDNNLS